MSTTSPSPTTPKVAYIERQVGSNEFRWVPRRRRPRRKKPTPNGQNTQALSQQIDPLQSLLECYFQSQQPNHQPFQTHVIHENRRELSIVHNTSSPHPSFAQYHDEDYEKTHHESPRNYDMHLLLQTKLRHCVDIFTKISLTRIHPAILNEENLQRFFYDDSPSAVNLNLAIGLCYGAAALGDVEMETEFWYKSRELAGALFDEPDFQVAVGLQRLSEYATNRGFIEQGQYYAVLGAKLCEHIQRCDSPVYTWLLYRLYLVQGVHPSFLYKLRRAAQNHRMNRQQQQQQLQLSQSQQPQQYNLPQANGEAEEEEADREKREQLFQNLLLRLTFLYVTSSRIVQDKVRLAEMELDLQLLQREWEESRTIFTPAQQLRLELILNGLHGAVPLHQGRKGDAKAFALRACELSEHPLYPFIPIMQRGVRNTLLVLLETQEIELLRALLWKLQPRDGGTFLDGVLEDFKVFLSVQ